MNIGNMKIGNMNIGKISTKFRNEKSFNDIDVSVLKSALQKYIRRADLDKALYCLIELDLFSLLPDDKRAKGLRTNLVNRMVCIMSEDIGIANLELPKIMHELYNKYVINKETKYLVEMCVNLVNSRKIRLISDYKSVFLLPPYYISKKTLLPKLIDAHKKCINNKKLYDVLQDIKDDESDTKDDEEYKKVKDNIINYIEKCDDNVFIWVSKMFLLKNKSKNKMIKELWKYLISKNDINKSLFFFYKKMNHCEKPIYLYHAILILVSDKIDNQYTPTYEIKINIEELIEKHKQGYTIEFDKFVYDLHTNNNKNISSKLENFAKNGAFVENEDINILNLTYREHYINLKKILDKKNKNIENKNIENKNIKNIENENIEIKNIEIKNIENENKNIENIENKNIKIKIRIEPDIHDLGIFKLTKQLLNVVQGQKRTAIFKKAVYIFEKEIYKGPYTKQKDFDRFMNNILYTKAFSIIEKELGVKTYLSWKRIEKDENDNYYFVSKNIGDYSKIIFEKVSSKIEENVNVAKRKSFIYRVSELDDNELTPEIIIETLQHLYTRYLLGIGDSGTHNVLLCHKCHNSKKQLIVGNDFEERRKIKEKLTKIECLFRKKPSKKEYRIYLPYISKIKLLNLEMYKNIKNELDDLKMDMVEKNITNFLIKE